LDSVKAMPLVPRCMKTPKLRWAVCFNAGNLLSINTKFVESMRDKEFIIYADNDANGIGEKKAIEAAQKSNAEVVMPVEEVRRS
jgi:phage/plasmid primase-like uncharacterized protein